MRPTGRDQKRRQNAQVAVPAGLRRLSVWVHVEHAGIGAASRVCSRRTQAMVLDGVEDG